MLYHGQSAGKEMLERPHFILGGCVGNNALYSPTQ